MNKPKIKWTEQNNLFGLDYSTKLGTYKEFQKALKIVNEYKSQLDTQLKEIKKEVNNLGKFSSITKETKLSDSDVSVRLMNILKANFHKFGVQYSYETKISDLSEISINEFLKYRLAGRKSLIELKELCLYTGVVLKP